MAQKTIVAAQDVTPWIGGGTNSGVVGINLKDGTGAFSGTITFEALIGGQVVPIAGESFTVPGTPVLSATANGSFRIRTAGTEGVRGRCSALVTADGMVVSTFNCTGAL